MCTDAAILTTAALPGLAAHVLAARVSGGEVPSGWAAIGWESGIPLFYRSGQRLTPENIEKIWAVRGTPVNFALLPVPSAFRAEIQLRVQLRLDSSDVPGAALAAWLDSYPGTRVTTHDLAACWIPEIACKLRPCIQPQELRDIQERLGVVQGWTCLHMRRHQTAPPTAIQAFFAPEPCQKTSPEDAAQNLLDLFETLAKDAALANALRPIRRALQTHARDLQSLPQYLWGLQGRADETSGISLRHMCAGIAQLSQMLESARQYLGTRAALLQQPGHLDRFERFIQAIESRAGRLRQKIFEAGRP